MDSIEARHRQTQSPHSRTTRAALLAAAVLALCLPAAASASVSPLPESDYSTRRVCPAPAAGHASCLALELAPTTGSGALRVRTPLAARGAPPSQTQDGPAGPLYAAGQKPEPLFPGELRSAYDLPVEPVQGSATQTIALVDAYNDPGAEADLKVYDNLPEIDQSECTGENGCFTKVNQNGESAEAEGASGNPFPKSAEELKERETTCTSTKQKAACEEVEEAVGWTVEISTDLDIAHSLCQSCHILLVEANSAEYTDLETAEETAVRLGATEVSNSWGGSEPPLDSSAFDHPGTVITAAAGDDGYLNWTEAEEAKTNGEGYYSGADYPASSPHVVAVGGTELTVTKAGARQSETVWNEDPDPEGKNEGAGGGCSTQFAAPQWQLEVPDWASVGCGTGAEAKRAVADVAADADPYSGVLVYDSEESTEYFMVIGGTSVASPIVASVFALAGGAHGVEYPAQTLYSRLGSPLGFPSLYDVTEGGNGKCDGVYTSCGGSMSPLSPLSPLDCGKGALICNAGPGYDGPTGVGAPNGVAAFEPESAEEHSKRVAAEEKAAEEKRAAEKKAEEERQAAEKKAAKELKAAEEKAASEQKATEELKAAEAARAAEQRAEEERKAAEAKRAAEAKAEAELKARTAAEERLKIAETQAEEEEEEEGNGASGHGRHGGKTSGRPRGGTVRLSRLALTARASAVIARGLPMLSQVAFAFNLSGPSHVRATLSRLVMAHGRARWAAATGTLTLTAPAGRDRSRLRGRAKLAPGSYRLTLAPAHGRARSIVFVLSAPPEPAAG